MLIFESLWDVPNELKAVPNAIVKEAAPQAFWQSFRYWPVRLSALGFIALPMAGSQIALQMLSDTPNGTISAALGFIGGNLWFQRQVRRHGHARFLELMEASVSGTPPGTSA
jgi:hypothetical protein